MGGLIAYGSTTSDIETWFKLASVTFSCHYFLLY